MEQPEQKDTFSDKVEAWLNTLSGKNKELAKVRMSICALCPYYVKLTSVCRSCGCPMVAKSTLQKKVCPLGKW